MPKSACAFCDQLLDIDAQNVWQMVEGWAQRRGKAGGMNQVRMPKSLGRYSHHTCLQMAQRGIGKGQGTLL